MTVAYRYSGISYANFDPYSDGDYSGSTPDVILDEYTVLSYTPCGFWIAAPTPSGKRFVNTKRTKQFAHLSQRDALEAFQKRTAKSITIMQARIRDQEERLRIAANLLEETSAPIPTHSTLIEL